jgi:hypothetical protein
MPDLRILSSALRQDPALEGAFVPVQPRPRLSFALYPPGLTLGGLIHLDGPACTEAVLRLLSEHPTEQAAWAEARMTAYPPAFVQRGVNLACLLFVETREHFPWAVTELVRSQVFSVVAVASALPDAMALRRLQLAAERAACCVLLAAPLPEAAWPVRVRLWCGWEGGEPRVAEAEQAAAAGVAEAGGMA